MAGITLKNIDKTYSDGFKAVKDLSLTINDTEFIVLVGPSGCGKSTTLRMIAGLEEITGGEMYIGKKKMNDVAPKDRDIAMVFQSYALYPDKTVYKNIAFGLERRKVPKDEIKKRVLEAAKILDLEKLLNRKPRALSGGQRQRVALGRAIVRSPAVFLFDEPLSNLDAKLRTAMRAEITKLHRDLKTTFVYVTHDQTEAMTMGDRIVVMRDGVIQQVDTPQNLYDKPCNMFVAGFIGSPQMNFIEGILQRDKSGWFVEVGNDKIYLDDNEQAYKPHLGEKVSLGVRPEDIITNEAEFEKESPALEGRVEIAELLGSEVILHISFYSYRIIARVSPQDAKQAEEAICFSFKKSKTHLFDNEGLVIGD